MIRTFVFFDLETTGLIQGRTMPRITEVSLIAVARNALSGDGAPRIVHKLILPIDPQIPVSSTAEKLTNLSNEALREVRCFDLDTSSLIVNFVNRLAKPACLVAHNGNNFDYPILLSEFHRVNTKFDGNILCIDTLPMFKDYYRPPDLVVDLNIYGDRASTKLCESDSVAVSQFQYNRQKSGSNPVAPLRFDLVTVHEHLTGVKPENSHSAESDCLAMLRCVSQMSEFFIEWADDNAVPLIKYLRKI